MPTQPTDVRAARRAAGVSRLGLAVGSIASLATLGLAFLGLGGPPAPASTASFADAAATNVPTPQVTVKTIYVQLPAPAAQAASAPSAAPVAAVRRAPAAVVTRQSGTKAGESEGQEGDD
jgi:hypothetical protein